MTEISNNVIILMLAVGVASGLQLKDPGYNYTVIPLNGGVGNVTQYAAFTRMPGSGNMFWWFYPSMKKATSPLVVWLDGVTGLPPSALANFGMIGPYDFNLKPRNNSWVDEYNLLFIDSPLGTGFSTKKYRIPGSLNKNVNHIFRTLKSFYNRHKKYRKSPLYIFGQGHGAQLALPLTIKIHDEQLVESLKGVVIGNGIISPAHTLSKLGFYLEQLGYIDEEGRQSVDKMSNDTSILLDSGKLKEAFESVLHLNKFVNENTGAVAVNLENIVEKLPREPLKGTKQKQYLKWLIPDDIYDFMEDHVAPALGICCNLDYDPDRDAAVKAFSKVFMIPSIDKVEHILQKTNLTVAFYNGNLDAVSNTPGQIEWLEKLQWSGQEEFNKTKRETLIINGHVEGYYKDTKRLKFYWVNVAGLSVPLDNSKAARRIFELIQKNN